MAMHKPNDSLVKQRFLADFPALQQQIPRARLREYLAGGGDRGYRCLWKGDLKNAHGIFRHALAKGVVGLKDLKYALPALLPFELFARLVTLRSRPGAT
jgi:hypothetical protein